MLRGMERIAGERGRRPSILPAPGALACALLLVAAGAFAEAPGDAAGQRADAGDKAGSAPAAPPVLDFDALLRLPEGRTYTVERRGGLTSGEWKARFAAARGAIAEERRVLSEAETRLTTTAEENATWQVAPPLPGQDQASPGDNTIDYNLRQAIRRHREEIERLERELREVEIEANLAGVPEAWRATTREEEEEMMAERAFESASSAATAGRDAAPQEEALPGRAEETGAEGPEGDWSAPADPEASPPQGAETP